MASTTKSFMFLIIVANIGAPPLCLRLFPSGNWQAVADIVLAVLLSLLRLVLFGSLAGSLLPFILRRIGFDPASASAPFVATLVDVSGLIIYCTVASLVLRGTVL